MTRAWPDDAMVTFCLIGKEVVNFGGCTIVGDDNEAFIVHVEDQILTLLKGERLAKLEIDETYHDGEADEADISAAG